jgi:hypothetical protein
MTRLVLEQRLGELSARVGSVLKQHVRAALGINKIIALDTRNC